MRPHIRLLLVLSLIATVMLPLAGSAAAAGDGHAPEDRGTNAVLDWNVTATKAAVECGISPGSNPLGESRLYAMTQLAVHDALNSIDSEYDTYTKRLRAPHWASARAAVAAAAHDVLVPGLDALAPTPAPEPDCAGIGLVGTTYAERLSTIPDGPAKWAGVAVGKAAAAAILHRRANDGAAQVTMQDFDYDQGTRPGEWRFTPADPGQGINEFAFAPAWGTVRPFALNRALQFSPGKPYALGSREYAADVNEVQRLGSLYNSTRTADQTQIAYFWVGSSPYQWNNVARNLASAKGLDMWQSARLFGLLNMALADGYISSFAVKYKYDYWRPVTAIRLANTDGNPDTDADPKWFPLVATPPIPDYDSAHSVEGGAAAAVLEGVLGKRNSGFSVCSLTLPDPDNQCGGGAEITRHFDSPAQAAAENGASRVYVGFHFRNAVNKGIKHGDQIGDLTVRKYLR